MDAASFGHIIRSLLLRKIGNVARHGRRNDQGPGVALLEMRADGLSAVEGSVEVGLDHVVPLLDAGVEDTGVCGATSVGNEGVDLAELFDDVRHELLDGGEGADIALVCFRFYLVFFREVFSILLATIGAGGVGDGNAAEVEERLVSEKLSYSI